MTLHDRIATAREEAGNVAASGPSPAVLARWALGLMLVAAGAHKLLDPVSWAVYVTGWLAPWLVVSPVTFMVANGYLELAFGAALLANRYTTFLSLVAAVSLTATVGYLGVVWATTGEFGDVLARDVGLTGLAWSVVAAELRPDTDE